MKTTFGLVVILVLMALASCGNDVDPVNSLGTKSENSWPLPASITGIPRPLDAYNYPAISHEEWMGLKGGLLSWDLEKKYSCVPLELVNSMSTSGLVQSILDNPRCIYPSFPHKVGSLYGDFIDWAQREQIAQLFAELEGREDAAAELLSMLKAFKPDMKSGQAIPLQNMYMELVDMFLLPGVFRKISDAEGVELIKTIFEKEKCIQNQEFSTYAECGMVLARVMLRANFEPMIELYGQDSCKGYVDLGQIELDAYYPMVYAIMSLAETFVGK